MDKAHVHTGLPGQEGVGDGAGDIGQLSGPAYHPCGRVCAREHQKDSSHQVHSSFFNFTAFMVSVMASIFSITFSSSLLLFGSFKKDVFKFWTFVRLLGNLSKFTPHYLECCLVLESFLMAF